jgi:glutamine amidotransferase
MIALIDYNMGNLLSVHKALESVGGDIELISKGSELSKADAVILPGVGNFGDGMEHLNSREFTPAIKQFIKTGKPFLGICLGLQMLLKKSEEAPGVDGLGIFDGEVVHFPKGSEKVPHMGWNDITITHNHPCLDGIQTGSFFYFVHSYYVKVNDPTITTATAEYILPFTAAIGCNNVFATQFHPEKSQDKGMKILKNFIKMTKAAPK